MATTFNTRIQNKIDTYENWKLVADSFIPLKGEICIATVSTQEDGVQTPPQVLMKIGDGTSNWGQLKWLAAPAADIIDSLKGNNPTLPASSITGLEDFIQGQIQDTDTQYQLVQDGNMGIKLQSKPKTGGEWSDVGSTITLTPPTYNLMAGDTNGTVKFGITGSESEVAVTGLKSAAYEDSSAFDTAGSAQAVKTELIGSAEDTSDLSTINGAKKYADEKATAAETNAKSYADGLIEALDSAGNAIGTGEIISNVTENNGVITVEKRTLAKEDIPTIEQNQVNGLTTSLAGKQDTLVFNTPYNSETNKAATMTDVTNAISGLSGAMHYVGESTTDPSEGTVTIDGKPEYSPSAGDVVTYQAKEYVYDGENWRELGDESSYAIKGAITNSDIAPDANIDQSKIANLTTDLASKATTADITSAIEALDVAITNVSTGSKISSIEQVDGKIQVNTTTIVADDIPELPTSKITGLDTSISGINGEISTLKGLVGETPVSTQITTAIEALDAEDTAVENQFVTQVSEENGIISVTRAQPTVANINGLQTELDKKANSEDLATVATSGKIDDLTQTATIIFNCGSSTEVID